MDLIYLYHRHGVSLRRAKQAGGKEARAAHYALAEGYAERILDIRRALTATA